MLKIRLQRVGRKHEPVFRVVVTDSHSGPKAGKSVEILGSYDPRFNKSEIKGERVKYWMGNGAQVSPTVHNLLVSTNILEGKKVNVLPKRTAIVKEEENTSTENKETEESPVAEASESPAPAEESAEEAKPAEETPKESTEEVAPTEEDKKSE